MHRSLPPEHGEIVDELEPQRGAPIAAAGTALKARGIPRAQVSAERFSYD